MPENQTRNYNILETAFIELVRIPLVRNLSCATLPLACVKVSLESRRNIGLPRGAVANFQNLGSTPHPSRKCRCGH